MNEKDFQAALLRRFDDLIALVMKQTFSEEITMTDKVLKLSGLGLSNSEVAGLVGKSSKYVAAILSEAKKHTRRRSKKNG